MGIWWLEQQQKQQEEGQELTMSDQDGSEILYIISFQADGKPNKVSVYARGPIVSLCSTNLERSLD